MRISGIKYESPFDVLQFHTQPLLEGDCSRLQCKVINGSMRNAYEQSEQVPEIIMI